MRTSLISALLFCTLSFQAQAFNFAINNFRVALDGNIIFNDSFTATAPPNAPNFSNGTAASYAIPAGKFSPAVNGKLRLNSAAATISPVVSAKLAVSAHLITDQTADTNKGLKPGHAFRVVGAWDAIAPAGADERYFIELSDWAADKTCDACIRLGVVKNTDGTVEVQFWKDKIGNDQILDRTILGKATFDPGSNQQIRFTLKKDSPTTNEVRASYAYVNNGVAGQEIELTGSANIFTARGFAIAAFKASAPAAYALTSGTNNSLTINSNINVASTHAGKTGNIYVVAVYNGLLFANNGTTWLAWDGVTTLPAYARDVVLTDRSINVLDKLNVSTLIGVAIYVGYGVGPDDMVTSKTWEHVYTVK